MLDITVDETVDSPTSIDFATADDTGIDNDNLTKNTTGLTITGNGESGGSVQLLLWDDANNDGNVDSGETSSLGDAGTITDRNFSIDVDLAEGVPAVTATQTDVAKNVSAANTAGVTITVDTTADAAPTSLDLHQDDDTGTNNDDITKTTTGLSISGSGVTGSSVQLYTWDDVGGNGDGNVDDGELIALGSAGTVANSAFSIVDLAEGTHQVVAKQTDVAGNVSVASSAFGSYSRCHDR